jgi:hypothetical protein
LFQKCILNQDKQRNSRSDNFRIKLSLFNEFSFYFKDAPFIRREVSVLLLMEYSEYNDSRCPLQETKYNFIDAPERSPITTEKEVNIVQTICSYTFATPIVRLYESMSVN